MIGEARTVITIQVIDTHEPVKSRQHAEVAKAVVKYDATEPPRPRAVLPLADERPGG